MNITMSCIEMTISILTAFLTSGMLLLFIESIHLEATMKVRFNAVMIPYYARLSSFLRFMNMYYHSLDWDKQKIKDDCVSSFKQALQKIASLGGQVIVSGGNYRHMSIEKAKSLANDINNIWYISHQHHSVMDACCLNRTVLKMHEEALEKEYRSIGLTDKYIINTQTANKISGNFYVDIYQKIEDVLDYYEFWEQKTKQTRCCMIAILVIYIILMLITFLFRLNIGDFILSTFVTTASILMGVTLYAFYKLSSLSNRIPF